MLTITTAELRESSFSSIENEQFPLAIKYHGFVIARLHSDNDVINLVEENISFCSKLIEHDQHDEAIRLADEFSNLIAPYYHQGPDSVNDDKREFDLGEMHDAYYKFIDYLITHNQFDLAYKYCDTFIQFELGDNLELSRVYNKLGFILVEQQGVPQAFNAFCKSIRSLVGYNWSTPFTEELADSLNKLKMFYQENSEPSQFFQFAADCYEGQSSPQQLLDFLKWIKKPNNSQAIEIIPVMIDHLELLLKLYTDSWWGWEYKNMQMKEYFSNHDNVVFIRDQIQQLEQLNSILNDDINPFVAAAKAIQRLTSENESLKSRITALESSRLNEMTSVQSSVAIAPTAVFLGDNENQKKRARDENAEDEPKDVKRPRTLNYYFNKY